MKVSEKIEITARAIRHRARERGYIPSELSELEAERLINAQAYENPNSIAGKFYLEASDRQWKRIYNKVIRK